MTSVRPGMGSLWHYITRNATQNATFLKKIQEREERRVKIMKLAFKRIRHQCNINDNNRWFSQEDLYETVSKQVYSDIQ
jgi:hypothetical protein